MSELERTQTGVTLVSRNSFEVGGRVYPTQTWLCNGCYKHDRHELHYHITVQSGETGRHQGQQMIAEYKDSDVMMLCGRSDEDGYCDCTPDNYNHNPETRKQQMEEYGVVWDPTITF